MVQSKEYLTFYYQPIVVSFQYFSVISQDCVWEFFSMSSSDQLAVLPLEALNYEIERDRQRRVDEHKREVAERGLTRHRLGEKGKNEPLNLYADGDSWFEYPPHR